jgi:hypothetical protein
MPLDCASDAVSRIDGEISTADAKLRCAATDHPLRCSLVIKKKTDNITGNLKRKSEEFWDSADTQLKQIIADKCFIYLWLNHLC